ncbi:MAG: DEAD/DEAH box helicase family protein [Leptospirales bacterium]|nr:DEAD/DEAH box helicase family protein [Leptospirales bacterium]
MKPEERARQTIDEQLSQAGWIVQDFKDIDLSAGSGIAIREFPLTTGFADYMLFVDRKAVGVVEAKPVGVKLTEVAEQTEKYVQGLPDNFPAYVHKLLPFAYESTSVETHFRDLRDPAPRSRRVFHFHRPETLLEWAKQKETLRARMRKLPVLNIGNLRDCQVEAINGLEKAFASDRQRSLIQMATGAGKSFTAVSFVYRLIKFANAKRILFLVDRSNLAKQAFKEFQTYTTPDDGRKFTELYNVQRLQSNTIDPVNKVVITTIQRLFSMLKGDSDFEAENEERSGFEIMPEAKEHIVGYNPKMPIETFDFIITDEAHRSIYNLWRQVLEYFDSFLIGLTATPSKQTIGFFHNNLVSNYSHEAAVADGVNVGFEVYRIRTNITEKGSKIEAGSFVTLRSRMTRKTLWQELDDDFQYTANQLDRDVVAKDQIRLVVRTFRDRLFTEIFPGRTEVPKTLVFAKDDNHAEEIVGIIREEFGKGNNFCKKITYRTTDEKPDELVTAFRTSYDPRIAVTVDMISTGTDIKPLECLLFMRDVRSRNYFEQMKGRGTRVIDPTDLQAVTPDAKVKTHFMIVDAVGVCENEKTDSRPLERKKTTPFDKLLHSVALDIRDEDTVSSLAGRLARLDRAIGPADRKEIESKAGQTIKQIVHRLLDAVDPDKQEVRAQEKFGVEAPSDEQIQTAYKEMADDACKIFDNATLRNLIIDIKKRNDIVIDEVSTDTLAEAGFSADAKEKAKTVVSTFQRFIDENKDELLALQILYSQPYGKRHLTYAHVQELAERIQKPPYALTPEAVWNAYERLEAAKVKKAGAKRLLTDIVSLVRYASGKMKILEPHTEFVDHRFEEWLADQKKSGVTFSGEQMEWLNMIKDHIATSVSVGIDDFEFAPFQQKGGAVHVYEVFGEKLEQILDELNERLVA